MPVWVEAGLWGLVSGSALVIGAAIAYLVAVPPRIVAFVMSFGSGVLISALSFDLMEEAFALGGLAPDRHRLCRWRGCLYPRQYLAGPPRREASQTLR